MKKRQFTATSLRLTLSVSLFLIAILSGVGLYFAQDSLRDTAVEVSHAVVDANASQDNVVTLQKIQKELDANKDVIDRTKSIVADSKSYQYQDQILTDLNDYAAKAGITITNLDFAASTGAAGSADPKVPAATTILPAGVKSTSVSVSIQNPVNYDNLLHFIKAIEQNLTKMQISKVSLTKGENGSDVSSEMFTIEVYIR